MKARSIVKSMMIAAGVLVWLGVLGMSFYGVAPGWLGLVALGLIPVLGCYLWIRDDIRSRRTDAYQPTRPQAMVKQDGGAPSREEYMRPKPIMRDDFHLPPP